MKSWNDYPATLTAKEASELLSISRIGTVTDLCKKGEMPAAKIGKQWRIDRDRLRLMFAPQNRKNVNLSDQLGEIELALSTLAAVHQGTKIEEQLRTAHAAALKAYNQAREDG